MAVVLKVTAQKEQRECYFEACNTDVNCVCSLKIRIPFPVEDKTKLKLWCKSLKIKIGGVLNASKTPALCINHFKRMDYMKKVQQVNGAPEVFIKLRNEALPARIVLGRDNIKTKCFDSSDLYDFDALSQLIAKSSIAGLDPAGPERSESRQVTQSPDEANVQQESQAYIDYEQGWKCLQSRSFKTAFVHWDSAARQGLSGALYNLGVMYEKGLGVKMSQAQALDCYKKAVAQGHKKALYNIGVYYSKGYCGITKDPTLAKIFFKKSGIKHSKKLICRPA